MIVYTDDRDYADHILPGAEPWKSYDKNRADPNLHRLKKRLFTSGSVYTSARDKKRRWSHALVVKHAPTSHFDHLIDTSQKDIELPDGTICLAGSGSKFHGQRKRPWAALEGNIHLAICFSPHKIIKSFHTGFPVLAAVSLIDALDAFEPLEGRAKIKWVNDILIDGAKVAGFLVHTQSVEDTVLTAIMGIGLNVEKTPRIKTDPFVPKVSCLRSFVHEDSILDQEKVLRQLLISLDKNYELLLKGKYGSLIRSYRECSNVIGRKVRIMSDSPGKEFREIAAGTVAGIGEHLELILKGQREPVTSGRLILA
jgi:biotin-[acetyl-CoA-carboxylase] ligase BirA-like protein